MIEKKWKQIPTNFPFYKIKKLKKETGYSKNFIYILLQKGLDTVDKINKFINCSLDDLYDPFLLPDIFKAIERIKKAKIENEKIIIYGDYDADGTISSSVLYRAFLRIGFKKENIKIFVPHRKFGYGLNNFVVNYAKRSNSTLIITCDCGSTDINEINKANQNNIDTIVIDHHKTITAKPFALINPHRLDSKYPFKELCGAGVVFKVIQALQKSGENVDAIKCLDYISIATVADVSPLIDENRIIVKYGMQMLSKTKQIPLKLMLERLSKFEKKMTSEIIGFMIGPRLNASGRISSANITIKFLLSNTIDEANYYYHKMNSNNDKRKLIEKQIKDDVIKLLENRLLDKVIVVSSNEWNKGVIGIVASVIMQFYTRPVILISVDDKNIGYGSIRNVSGFPLLTVLEKCKSLMSFGGHEMAAGIKIKAENIDLFRKEINNISNEYLNDDILTPTQNFNLNINEDEINFDFLNELSLLEPYGTLNDEPLFSINDCKVVEKNVKERHLILKISQKVKTLSAPAFWFSDYNEFMIDEHQTYDFLFYLSMNYYNDMKSIQLIIEDIKEVNINW